MAQCVECGAPKGFFEGGRGLCQDCFSRQIVQSRGGTPPTIEAQTQRELAERAAIEAVLLTTETAPALPIAEHIEIVTAECAFGMNIFKDLFAGVRDIVGGRSKAVQTTMRDARRTALFELKREAWLVGADAVVGVDLDYVELSSAGSMVMLVASGTAVRLSRPQ